MNSRNLSGGYTEQWSKRGIHVVSTVPAAMQSAVAAGLATNPSGGCVLPTGSTACTFYLSDPQFENLGSRGFTHNPLLKRFLPTADRNIISTQTADVFVDELLRQACKDNDSHHMAIEIKGDVADTPARTELGRLEKILWRHGLPIEGYSRGNHSSGCAFGVVNLFSPHYTRFTKVPVLKFTLDDQVAQAAGSEGNVLNPQATMEKMHHILNGQREDHPGPKRVTTAVQAADEKGYQLVGSDETVAFTPENAARTFETFWRPSRGTQTGLPRETRYWECIINYDIADSRERLSETKVNPIYIQASEVSRFRTEDGTDYPVYTISIDGLDHRNLMAIDPEISLLQARLIDNFMDRMLRENPRARFKISSHFSAESLTKPYWLFFWRRFRNGAAREAFRKILSREEVILVSYGHTHERSVTDINKTLKLGRKTPLMEVNVPSLIDYHPSRACKDCEDEGARAIVVEKTSLHEDSQGKRSLQIDLHYRGLDPKDITEGVTPAVLAELEKFKQEHGYLRNKETLRMYRNKHAIGWIRSHLKRFVEVFTVGLNPFRWSKFTNYWKRFSPMQYLVDNLTVASTVNMFSEAYHLMPFIESVARFIGKDDEPGQLAVRGQLLSLRRALVEEYVVRLHDFEEALANGQRASELRAFNDLFGRTRMHRLPDLLMRLKAGGAARAFAILAGIEASKGEFIYHKKKPTTVPSRIPTITIPL